jgi:pimeloyl-ACP methyl ester carboxylesterase
MLKTIIVALLASIGTAPFTLAAERQINFEVDGQRVEGTLMLPDEVEHPPIVLMLHGFGGTRNEWTSSHVPKGLFGQAAETLAQRGIASLRIDFRGSGASEGKLADVTVNGEVKDAIAAMEFLRSRDDIDSQRISVLGMSLGGVVASAVAARQGDHIRSVVLWNPGVNLPAAFTALVGLGEVRKGLAGGDQPVDISLPNGSKIALRSEFFESLYEVVPAAEISRYAGPLLVMIGTKDDLVFPQPVSIEAFLSYHPGQHELWQRPVDHGFNVEQTSQTVSALIDDTGDYLQKNFD